MREEGGTPDIVGSIRVGLVMQLQQALDPGVIKGRELALAQHAMGILTANANLKILGPHSIARLPVISFLVQHAESDLYLHHNFVCALLNDLFGIQSRGGCACAGPYAQV